MRHWDSALIDDRKTDITVCEKTFFANPWSVNSLMRGIWYVEAGTQGHFEQLDKK